LWSATQETVEKAQTIFFLAKPQETVEKEFYEFSLAKTLSSQRMPRKNLYYRTDIIEKDNLN
jgi:hypothetical protein